MRKELFDATDNVTLDASKISEEKLSDVSLPVKRIIKSVIEGKSGCANTDFHQYYIESPSHEYYVDT